MAPSNIILLHYLSPLAIIEMFSIRLSKEKYNSYAYAYAVLVFVHVLMLMLASQVRTVLKRLGPEPRPLQRQCYELSDTGKLVKWYPYLTTSGYQYGVNKLVAKKGTNNKLEIIFLRDGFFSLF